MTATTTSSGVHSPVVIKQAEERYESIQLRVADMITAFRYVFGAAAALMGLAALCMIMMEERTLAGPSRPVATAK